MSWTNPPAVITALRTMLAASSNWTSIVGAGNETSRQHYPQANLDRKHGTPDTLPFATLALESATYTKFAVGAAALPSGRVSIEIRANTDIGTLEIAGSGILADLLALDTGLPLTSGEVGPCSDVSPGQRSASDTDDGGTYSYRTIVIVLNYALTA